MKPLDMLVIFVWGFVCAWLTSHLGLAGWAALFVVFLISGRRS